MDTMTYVVLTLFTISLLFFGMHFQQDSPDSAFRRIHRCTRIYLRALTCTLQCNVELSTSPKQVLLAKQQLAIIRYWAHNSVREWEEWIQALVNLVRSDQDPLKLFAAPSYLGCIALNSAKSNIQPVQY